VQNEATGETALIEAVCQGHESIVELLIAEGANLEAKYAVLRGTPLWWAASCGKLAVVRILRDHGANIDPSNAYDETPLLDGVLNETTQAMAKLLLELGADVGATNLRGQTPVLLAALLGSEPPLCILLDHCFNIENGSLIDRPDINGRTPLSLVA
jgi:ankyrin repeat protein